jgi:hypothetical protein
LRVTRAIAAACAEGAFSDDIFYKRRKIVILTIRRARFFRATPAFGSITMRSGCFEQEGLE